MLEKIDLSKKMGKEEAKERLDQMGIELSHLQRECKAAKIPVMIAFEGLGASGKGVQINKLIQALDPRGFDVYSVQRETEEEKMRPFLWRFWSKTPETGRIAIFDRSWYRRVLGDRFDGLTPKKSIPSAFSDIHSFERQLTDDGTVMIKLFLYISKKEQEKRFKKLRDNKETAWRVSKEDLRRNEEYDQYLVLCDEMLEQTDFEFAPWTIVEATDREYAAVKIMNVVIHRLRDALVEKKLRDEQREREEAEEKQKKERIQLEKQKKEEQEEAEQKKRKGKKETEGKKEKTVAKTLAKAEGKKEGKLKTGYIEEYQIGVLSGVDLSKSLSEKEYKEKLDKLQKKLELLHSELYRQRIPVILAFEGWDAAGKGGAIKRLTSKLDPRGYAVCPTSAANDIERKHHYLWRFWNKMPKAGHIAIFDRTWYGRVMVERIEGFCTTAEWKRAYQEINEMEEHLVHSGAIILKFWMQIDKDEQERRFKDRMETPEKQWKITEEDWRNRAKWEEYEKAVDEMLVRTSTTYAPWTVVEANSKQYARVKVLETVVKAIEEKLKELK